MKMNFKIVIGKKLIDQHLPFFGQAIAYKGHQVAVVDPANDLNFRLKLAVALAAARLEALHGDLLAIGQHTLVDIPEPTLAEQVPMCEPSSRHQKLVIGEGVLVEP